MCGLLIDEQPTAYEHQVCNIYLTLEQKSFHYTNWCVKIFLLALLTFARLHLKLAERLFVAGRDNGVLTMKLPLWKKLHQLP